METATKPLEKNTTGFCRDFHETIDFFNGLIGNKELLAYNVEINKRITEKDDDYEQVVRTIKGATLTPTDKLSHSDSYFLNYLPTNRLYCLHQNFRISNSDFEDLEHKYGHCDLVKLVNNSKLHGLSGDFGRISIPKELIDTTLSYGWTHDTYNGNKENWYKGTRHEKSGILRASGEKDELLSKVTKFFSLNFGDKI